MCLLGECRAVASWMCGAMVPINLDTYHSLRFLEFAGHSCSVKTLKSMLCCPASCDSSCVTPSTMTFAMYTYV